MDEHKNQGQSAEQKTTDTGAKVGTANNVDFGQVLRYIQQGPNRFARHGWNGKHQYIQLQVPDENSANTLPYIFMAIQASEGQVPDRVPWVASQTDMLSSDWFAV